jgi:N-methylhydantoinase A
VSVRIGVDVGGTFTDIVCFDEDRSFLTLLKVPSTPDEPNRAVVDGTLRILKESNLSASRVAFFIHGTTVATNAVLEGKGAQVALLVTKGFRDVLYIMRQDRPRLYDYFQQRPEPLVPRRLRFEIPERMLHTGERYLPLDREATRPILQGLKAQGIADVAVCLLHSYANPAHELELGKMIMEEIVGARVSLSSDILAEFKEFERMSTTVINAYVMPVVGQYLGSLEDGVRSLGIASGLHMMQSNGGIMSAQTARRRCVHTVLSGPAAGALSGMVIGEQVGIRDLISIDVGGTSADVSMVYGGRLNFAEETEIGGRIVKIPSIEVHTVGAGGGSVAWIDAGGALQVGPQSAGANPGPACYGKGGEQPTVTDANLVLGRLNAAYFLGGEIAVDVQRAHKAIQDKIAGPLGLTPVRAAEGIIRVINSVMAKAIRRLSVEKGYDPREFTLVSFGGAGPLHAAELAADLQIPRILVPPAPGVSSAMGLITADFRHDYVRSVLWKTNLSDVSQLTKVCAELRAAAADQMSKERVESSSVDFVASLDMRYLGQGFSLNIRFRLEELGKLQNLDTLVQKFHEAHFFTYGYSDQRALTEIVNVRLAAIGRLPRADFTRLGRGENDARRAEKGTREIYIVGEFQKVRVYERSKLGADSLIQGPAVVEQVDSTTLVLPDQRAATDEFGNLMLEAGG